MRTMVKNSTKLNIVAHIILRNMWEYYIVEDEDESADDDIKLALVMGHVTELGSVSMEEISPYIISRTNNLDEVMPAEGWSWEN